MAFELFSRVALQEDFPHYKLKQGDIATVIEHHLVKDGEDGYSLEVFNSVGETIAVLIVSESQIQPLLNNEILNT
ncbi:DUF4926 domain-containing protein [Oculatella sp. FACHB-28]|uniref:DUF4926 domain-containing protein n=1 Tax=Cyanophyceae TaxID=3028117 RepID=UPI0016892DF7|nr:MULTISPECIES: DUF4926 domain-containing protein [Cyanophyceae]MBD2056981.1 DUF4926 domain-containing protein [Oculatella sp. FACHB-28]MBD2067962.1 DUF4926 domain-containing protein [Leptolyngbya sp. FACHB-671]